MEVSLKIDRFHYHFITKSLVDIDYMHGDNFKMLKPNHSPNFSRICQEGQIYQ